MKVQLISIEGREIATFEMPGGVGPCVGDVVEWEGSEFEVLDSSERPTRWVFCGGVWCMILAVRRYHQK